MQVYKCNVLCSCNLVVLLCESQIDQNIGCSDLVVELAVHSATQPTLTYGAEETPENNFSVSNTTTSAKASDSEASAIALVSNVFSDIASSMEEKPAQPVNISFPSTSIGGKERSFNTSWYQQHPWLEYSMSKNAIFCFPCRFFCTNADNKLVKTGYCDWKHATGKTGALAKHSVSEKHQEAMAAWSAFNTQPHTSVASLLDNNRSNLIRKNRHYVKVIIKVILFCAVQEISLRGHREVESLNKGNFLELLELLSDTDEILKAQLRTLPRNATYTSHAIQNEILHILASKVRSIICTQVKEAQYFSISADETRDVSKQEQMSFIVRYFSEYDQSIQERFLTYIHTTAFDASSLTQYIKNGEMEWAKTGREGGMEGERERGREGGREEGRQRQRQRQRDRNRETETETETETQRERHNHT